MGQTQSDRPETRGPHPPRAFGGGAQTRQPGLPRREQNDQGTDQLQQAGQGNMGGVRGTRRRPGFESSQLLASALNGPDDRPAANGDSVVEQIVAPQIGYDRPALVTQRVNQQYFRNTLIHNYHDHCCITGIAIDPLLVASHIKPWKDSSPTEKVAASNGLLLNAFHDRAFDQGLITLDNDFAIHVSPHVEHTEINDEWLYRYDGQRISLPVVCSPSREFLEFHREHIYQL